MTAFAAPEARAAFDLSDGAADLIIAIRHLAAEDVGEVAGAVLPDGWRVELTIPDPLADDDEQYVRFVASASAPFEIAAEHWTQATLMRALVLLDALLIGFGDVDSDQHEYAASALFVTRRATPDEQEAILARVVAEVLGDPVEDDDPDKEAES